MRAIQFPKKAVAAAEISDSGRLEGLPRKGLSNDFSKLTLRLSTKGFSDGLSIFTVLDFRSVLLN